MTDAAPTAADAHANVAIPDAGHRRATWRVGVAADGIVRIIDRRFMTGGVVALALLWLAMLVYSYV